MDLLDHGKNVGFVAQASLKLLLLLPPLLPSTEITILTTMLSRI